MLTELQVSNELQFQPEKLRSRLEEDGYLFFKQLLDVKQLMALRKQMLTVLQDNGWLKSGSDPMDGIAVNGKQCTEGDLEYSEVYHQVYRLESFHAIAHSTNVLDLLERIRGCSMIPQPQKVARLWFPNFTDHTTPTHQDFVHFQGTHDNLTCWSPIGDCPRELGGLAILKGSHKVDRVLDHHFSLGAGSLHLDPVENGLGEQWLTTDFSAGDTLIFPALTVHKALPNLTEDRLRVSLDNRYQRASDPIAEHMLGPHLNSIKPITWDEVYSEWQTDEFQYYWKGLGLEVLPRITEYLDQAFEEALEMAQSGDAKAILHLERTILKDPESAQAIRASMAIGKS